MRSNDRILTTHVGSLPRSEAVTEGVFAKEQGKAIDEAAFAQTLREAVTETVQKQVASGVDIVSDGEQSKISYATYIKDRITGFEGDSPAGHPKTSSCSRITGPLPVAQAVCLNTKAQVCGTD